MSLQEILGASGSPDSKSTDFSPVVWKALVMLLALSTQQSFVSVAQKDESMLARLWELTEYKCVPHPAQGEKPQEMIRYDLNRVYIECPVLDAVSSNVPQSNFWICIRSNSSVLALPNCWENLVTKEARDRPEWYPEKVFAENSALSSTYYNTDTPTIQL